MSELVPRRHGWGVVGSAFLLHMAVALVSGWVGINVVAHGAFWAQQPHASPWFIDIASRWDAGWYIPIAKGGYGSPVDTAFFPLYPLCVASVHAVLSLSYNVSAYAISLAAFLGSLSVVYALAAKRYGPQAAARAVLLVALVPGALFSTALYPESLMLLTAALFLLALEDRRWWLAGAVGVAAGLSCDTGVFLAVPALWCAFPLIRGGWRNASRALPAIVSPVIGLGSYLVYCWRRFGNPVEPMAVEHAHFKNALTFPLEAEVKEALALLLHHPLPITAPRGSSIFVYGANDVMALCVLGACAWMLWRREWVGAALFSLLSCLVAVSAAQTGDIAQSVPRIVAVLVPAWIFLASKFRDDHWSALIAGCVLLFSISQVLFAGGYWLT